jgi:FkbM family methyltransferase
MVAQKLIEREVYRLRNFIDEFSGRKIAIFAAGNYGQQFFKSLKINFGIEAEFFIDNNPALHGGGGGSICGKQVLFEPWKIDTDFAQKYFILIATKPLWVKQISLQLSEVGIPHISSDAYTAVLLWERVKNIVRLLEDDYSRAAYLGLTWYWLTHDTSLCQSSGNQYFDLVSFSSFSSDIIVDLGAFVGDTMEEYVRRSLGACKIYAFEPDESNFKALELRLERLKSEWRINDSDLSIIPAGAGAETCSAYFNNMELSKGSHLSDSGVKEVKIFSLDDFFKDKQPPTVIKADIEGAEQDMIRGAEGIIKNHKPKMAICIYHYPDDFVKIVEMIKDLKSGYNFAVRTHSSNFEETVLYCY